MPIDKNDYELIVNYHCFDIIFRISIDKLKEVWYTKDGQMEHCTNIVLSRQTVHPIERKCDEYGNRTESPYRPPYADTAGRHSDPYPTISDQAYSHWRIGWL